MARARKTPPSRRFVDPQDLIREQLKKLQKDPEHQMAHWAKEAKKWADEGRIKEARRKRAGL